VHGDLFEFVGNGDLNARNAFSISQDTLKQNQFGGTIGGRIIKNKLFFFAGYQGTRNAASIIFDNHAAIPTKVWSNKLDIPSPVSHVGSIVAPPPQREPSTGSTSGAHRKGLSLHQADIHQGKGSDS
jgi:hypothetical protein